MTGSVLTGMAGLVDSCEQKFGNLSGKLVLDVGCNDGSLLDFFKAKGCRTIGVDPTGAALESKHPTLNTFFDNECAIEILNTLLNSVKNNMYITNNKQHLIMYNIV